MVAPPVPSPSRTDAFPRTTWVELVATARRQVRCTHDERRALSQELLVRAGATAEPEARAEMLDAVIGLNHRVALAVARRYSDRGIDLEDLEQAAAEGLVKAVRRFDPARQHDLLSYAVPSIRGEVLRFFRDHGWMVRPPRRVQELQLALRRASSDLSISTGREATPDEVREATGTSRADYAEAGSALGCFTPASLDQPPESGSTVTLGDTLAAEDALGAAEARLILGGVLGHLGERDATVLYLRFFEEKSQREIGTRFGVTQATVSRWLGEILAELRGAIEGTAEPVTAVA
ncbi:sigma-70 family RNA polymerase sigma factor [uncultured Nocardioides sp.]|uniref:sigma-70 family RNA polymerase sigma factor n=1 Tax=uncultured Nocardioides sp. TaxID=198441 RepID=UPI002634BC6D|nr:sigma-70 family RNA polymerase sigma factor [uncultured Nocardioides sp.]